MCSSDLVAPPVDFPAFADRYVSSGSEPQQEISEPLPDFISIEENVVIGRDVAADVYLEHIQVSRRHARIFQRGDESFIQDLGSANGTFVDGELVTAPRPLKMNAVIRIGPYSLTFVGQRLVPTSAARNPQLEGRGLTRRVPDKDKPGETKTIELVAIAGNRTIYGGNALISGSLDTNKEQALQNAAEAGFKHEIS